MDQKAERGGGGAGADPTIGLMRCHVCFDEPMKPPIMTCCTTDNSHVLCLKCWDNINSCSVAAARKCPQCRGSFPEEECARNRLLERQIEYKLGTMKCEHGCGATFLYGEMTRHYEMHLCADPGCDVVCATPNSYCDLHSGSIRTGTGSLVQNALGFFDRMHSFEKSLATRRFAKYGAETYHPGLPQDVRDLVRPPTKRMERMAAGWMEDWTVSLLYGFQTAENYCLRTEFGESIYLKLFVSAETHQGKLLYYYAHTMSANSVDFDLTFEADVEVGPPDCGYNTNATLTVNAVAQPRATAPTIVLLSRALTYSFFNVIREDLQGGAFIITVREQSGSQGVSGSLNLD